MNSRMTTLVRVALAAGAVHAAESANVALGKAVKTFSFTREGSESLLTDGITDGREGAT
jgi:hypothetical protein